MIADPFQGLTHTESARTESPRSGRASDSVGSSGAIRLQACLKPLCRLQENNGTKFLVNIILTVGV